MVTVGIDLARDRDRTALVRLTREGDQLTVTGVDRLPTGRTWAEIVALIANHSFLADASAIAVDSTGVGAAPSEALRTLIGPRVHPVLFTVQSKNLMMKFLVEAIRSRRLTVAPGTANASDLIEELGRFRMVPTRRGARFSGKAGGGRDDIVMALALAIFAIGQR